MPARHLAGVLHAAGWRGARPVAWGTSVPPPGRRSRVSATPGGPPDGAARLPAAIADPLGHLARAGRQRTGTTCGSAVLAMLAAVGDPRLATWLVTGRPVAGTPELVGADARALALLAGASVEDRFAVLHGVLQRRTARVGPPWPTALGTPPWGAARVARFPGVRWTHHPLGGAASVGAHLARVRPWVAAGVPVPLYTGGDLAHGVPSAVPRHVVLLTDVDASTGPEPTWRVWEPHRGAVLGVGERDLVVGGRPHAALGGWSRVVWALVPWRADAGRARMERPSPSERRSP